MRKDLYQELCKVETLKLASNYFWDDQKDNFIPDVIRFQDYLFNLNDNLLRLSRNLLSGTYRPHPLKEIDVPKSGLSVRPGSVLDIEDHIVLFAIAYLLAPILDKNLPPNVYHFRVKRKNGKVHPDQLFHIQEPILLKKPNRAEVRTFEEWYEAWPDFINKAQVLYEEAGFSYLVETDISSYFENISHPLLADVLRKHAPNQLRTINLLMEMIAFWTTPTLTGIRFHRGIPQGNEISSWLGTLFLIPMDEVLIKYQRRGLIKYIRYVDDIKIFTKNITVAREMVFLINTLLRQLHLNLQTSKTEIFEGKDVKERLYNKHIEEITSIIDELPNDIKNITLFQRKSSIAAFKPIYSTCLSRKKNLSKEDLRLFKRSLTLLMLLKEPIGINLCLKALWSQPVLTEKIAKYLRLWMGRRNVCEAIESALFANLDIFATQYLYLLPLLRNSKSLNLKHYQPLMSISLNMNIHWAARSEALLTLILFPLTDKDFIKLEGLYHRESFMCVKKMILALFLKAPDKIRNSMFKTTIYEPEEEINRFRKYLWALCYSPTHAQPNLRIISAVEKDPARLIVSLYGAILSKNENTLTQVQTIGMEKSTKASSEIAKQCLVEIAISANKIINNLHQ